MPIIIIGLMRTRLAKNPTINATGKDPTIPNCITICMAVGLELGNNANRSASMTEAMVLSCEINIADNKAILKYDLLKVLSI